MSNAPPAVSAAQTFFDKRVKHAMACELADLAWSIHEKLGGLEWTAKSRKIDQASVTAERLRLAELATMLREQAAEIDPLNA